MDRAELPWPGGCRCGRVRIAVTRPPLLWVACHCRGCQAMTGSAFSLTLMPPAEGLEVLSGDLERGGLHGADRRLCCVRCKTWVLSQLAGREERVNLRPSVLDDHHWVEPYIEVFTEEKLPGARTPARYGFERIPAPGEAEALLRAYAAQTGPAAA